MDGQRDRELRERLRALGAVLGVPLSADDGAEWRVEAGTVRIGLGHYAGRGHGEREAVALAAVQLWEAVRSPRSAPSRARRRRALGARRPELEPLLAAIDRLQAGAELLATLPSLRGDLAVATLRGIPGGLRELPRHLQWIALLLVAGLVGEGRAEALDVDARVRGEWEGLGSSPARTSGERAPAPVLRRVVAADPAVAPLRRWERALAVLLPAYERLLALDLGERGLGEPGAAAGGADTAGEPGAPIGSSAAGAETAEDARPAEERDAPEQAQAAPRPEHARPGERPQSAEGADLFAAEQAGFVRSVLPTPLPAEGALVEAILELQDREAGAETRSEPLTAAGGDPGAAGSGATQLTDYLDRLSVQRPRIEAARALWQRVIAERIAPRRTPSRRPLESGETLDGEALASAVTEVHAGVRSPQAFSGREIRARRTRRAGSTDYVLLVDRSASMQGAAAEAAADAALVLLESLTGAARDIEHAEALAGVDLELRLRVALIAFDAEPLVVAPLAARIDDGARRRLHAAIRSPQGSTNDAAALRAAAVQLGVEGARGAPRPGGGSGDGIARTRIVILVSDGGTNDPVAAAAELRRLERAGVHVYGIGIGGGDIPARYAPRGFGIGGPEELTGALLGIVEEEALRR